MSRDYSTPTTSVLHLSVKNRKKPPNHDSNTLDTFLPHNLPHYSVLLARVLWRSHSPRNTSCLHTNRSFRVSRLAPNPFPRACHPSTQRWQQRRQHYRSQQSQIDNVEGIRGPNRRRLWDESAAAVRNRPRQLQSAALVGQISVYGGEQQYLWRGDGRRVAGFARTALGGGTARGAVLALPWVAGSPRTRLRRRSRGRAPCR
jgi:hypothetical protein